ncbi:MAG: hypothetical protein E7029_08730, partial [Planctomycetaceae bacterium]|nr:hypothetical protein [Planctomycetaceae bacterium]
MYCRKFHVSRLLSAFIFLFLAASIFSLAFPLAFFSASAFALETQGVQTAERELIGTFSEDGKTLLGIPCDYSGRYVVPEGVTHIAEDAFYECERL